MLVLFCSSVLSFPVLQSSCWGRERESLVLWYVLNFVSPVFFESSWSCHGLVCRMWLWHFLVILIYLLVFLLHHGPNMFASKIFVFTINRNSGRFWTFYSCAWALSKYHRTTEYIDVFSIVWLAVTLAMPFMEQERSWHIKWCAECQNLSTTMWATCLH